MFAIDCAAMTKVLQKLRHPYLNFNTLETYRFDHECPDQTRDHPPRRHQHEHRVDTLPFEIKKKVGRKRQERVGDYECDQL